MLHDPSCFEETNPPVLWQWHILLLQLTTCQSDPSQAIEKGIPSATSICSCQGWVRQQHASRGLRGTQSCGNAVWLWLCHQLPKFQDKRAPWVVSIDDKRKEAMNHYFCPEQWTPKMFGHQRPKTLFVAVFILALVEIIRSHTLQLSIIICQYNILVYSIIVIFFRCSIL